MSEYILANKFSPYRNGVAVVGCGGTGAFAAEGIARMLLGYPQLHLILIDGDRVEERNLGRQSFYPEDLGRFKCQALAERLARRYRTRVAYSTSPLRENGSLGRSPLSDCALVVGAVDNAPARAAIASHITLSQWWIDTGNGAEFGQLLVGNARAKDFRGLRAFDTEKGECHALPLPTLVRPELLVQEGRRPSCAQAVGAGEQGPTVNLFMAALVVEAVRRLLEGRLTWSQAYLDLESGALHTVQPTPEAVSRLTGVRIEKLFERR